jgi:hypothetical protein
MASFTTDILANFNASCTAHLFYPPAYISTRGVPHCANRTTFFYIPASPANEVEESLAACPYGIDFLFSRALSDIGCQLQCSNGTAFNQV